jgi:hypothetical protein
MKVWKCDVCMCCKCKNWGGCDSCNYCVSGSTEECDNFEEKETV